MVPVAICSGNHDNAGRTISHNRASFYKSFIQRRTHPNIIMDGSTRKLENLIVRRFLIIVQGEKSQSGSIEVSRFAIKPGCRGSFFITFRPKRARASAAKNQKPPKSLQRISLIISSRAMITRFRTRPDKAGTKNWASRACWCPVSCCVQQLQTTSR